MRLWPVLLLAGCAGQPATGQLVEWIKVPPEQIHKVCMGKSSAVLTYYRYDACSMREGGICRIYAPDFKAYEMAMEARLGHELKHCFDGRFHNQGQMRN